MKKELFLLALIVILAYATGYAQTREEVLTEIVDQGIEHPEIVMAQCRLETGNLTSRIYMQNNNLFGMKEAKQRETTAEGTKNNHAYYSHWKESIADYKLWQDRYYKEGDYYEFLEGMGYATSPTYIKKLKEFNITL